MVQHIIDLLEEEEKALSIVALSTQDWLNNMAHNRARQAIDEIVRDYSDKQPEKVSFLEKLQIVRDVDVKSAAEVEALRE